MNDIQSLTWKSKPVRAAGSALVLVGFVVALVVFATGCGHKQASTEEKEAAPAIAEVETTSIVRRDMTRDVDQPGFLKPFEMTPIYTKIAGFCLDWKYDLGDRVKKDTLLVQLWVPEVVEDLKVKAAKIEASAADVDAAKAFAEAAAAAVEAAKADVDAKLASIRTADADVKRWIAEEAPARRLFYDHIYDKQTWDEQVKQLSSSEAVKDESTAKWLSSTAKFKQSQASLIKAKADVQVAAASLKMAEAAWAQWKAWLDYREIKAPYDGVITLRNVAVGDFLQPSNSGSTSKAAEPLYIMMRTDIMRCTIEVPEKDAVLLKNGDKAEVYLQAMPGAPLIGTVKRNSGALDTNSRTLRVEVYLDNPGNKLLPAMYANVRIRAKLPNAWSLPETAVLQDILADKDLPYCFIVRNGKAEKTFMEVGQSCEEGIPILRLKRPGSNVWENIKGDEVVVASNGKALLDGQAVQVKAPAAK